MISKGDQEIEASITITAQYDDRIFLSIKDKKSGIRFVDLELTREQFINAAMNRLAECNVKTAHIHNIANVGKKLERKPLVVEIPAYHDDKAALAISTRMCPPGWDVEPYFTSQDSFFSKGDKFYARTSIVRWV